MATKRRLKSDVSDAIHSSAAMLDKVGALDKTTMREDTEHFRLMRELCQDPSSFVERMTDDELDISAT